MNNPETTSLFQLDAETQLCAVIGNPVAHSLSPAMHNAAFQATGLNYVYLAFEVTDLAGTMAGMRALQGFRGMSVTIPHKVAVMNHLDEVTPQAREVGCVNTIINESGRLVGAITDGLGTLRAFERANVSLAGKAILFVGTGGAARAVAFAMATASSPSLIRILGRTAAHVKKLSDDLRRCSSVPIYSGSLEETRADEAAAHDIIVHATPVGMHGHSEGESNVPTEWLHSGQVVFDMVYRPRKTKLLKNAVEAHCKIIPGLEMLLYQAAIQFELWTKQPAPESVMRKALLEALQPSVTEL